MEKLIKQMNIADKWELLAHLKREQRRLTEESFELTHETGLSAIWVRCAQLNNLEKAIYNTID